MEFHDTARIDTPEGVQLELTLAGLGSRMVAQLWDSLVKLALFVAAALVGAAVNLSFGLALTGLVVLILGYELLFEAVWSGRTPGKRWAGIRVVSADGGAASFGAVVVRNLMRIIDIIPGTYGVGAISVFATEKNQRLGDLAAGTVVVREHTLDDAPLRAGLDHVRVPPGFDATAVTQEHLALARSFQLRKDSLQEEPRRRLAAQVAGELRKHVMDPQGGLADEALIEVVIVVKTGRRS